MIDPAEPNQNQGQFDLGNVLHPVQFRDHVSEQRIRRQFEWKFGRHGEGHAQHMYEVNLDHRRKMKGNAGGEAP